MLKMGKFGRYRLGCILLWQKVYEEWNGGCLILPFFFLKMPLWELLHSESKKLHVDGIVH